MENRNNLLHLLFLLHLACPNKIDCSKLSESSQNLVSYINRISNHEIKESLLEKFNNYEDGFSSYSSDLSEYFYETGFGDAISLILESVGGKENVWAIWDNL